MYSARNLEDALAAPMETAELHLSGRGLTDFPLEVLRLPSLKVLDLSHNLIRNLPEAIAELPCLEALNLRSNQLRELPATMGELRALQRLELDENQLAGLPHELSFCDGLRTLRLSSNSFTEWPAHALPPCIESLTIAHNQLSQVPESVRHLHVLTYLDLRHNRLHGLPGSLVLIEGLSQVLLEGNPLELAVESSHPEGVLERFFKDIRRYQGASSVAKYPPMVRQCWLRMVLGGMDLLADFSVETCLTALDSPLAAVRAAASAVLSGLLPSPLPNAEAATLLLAGQFPRVAKPELQKALVAAGFTLVNRLPAAIVAVGERGGATGVVAYREGHSLAFEGHLEAWWAIRRGEFLQAAPASSPLQDNLRRLIRSYKKENIAIALVMMDKAGAPPSLLTDLLGIRLFHPDLEVRHTAGHAFKELAERRVRAFVDRQLKQHFHEEEPYNVHALVEALCRNTALDARGLVQAALELKGAQLSLVTLLPEEEWLPHLDKRMQEGQLNLSSMGLERIPQDLHTLAGLRYLVLSRNQLVQLPADWSPFSTLAMLDLADNRLTSLPDGMGTLKQLAGLDLSHNRLRQVPDSMGDMRSLEALRLDHNPLQDLPETLVRLSRLEMLGLHGCRFPRLPAVIWDLQQLRALDIGDNQLHDLPETVTGFLQLESLSLKGNPLQRIPDWVGGLPALRFLDLSGVAARTLPETLRGHPRMERMYLIRDEAMDWEQVVPLLASMPRLRHVYLRGRKMVRQVQLRIERQLPSVRVLWNG